VQKGWSIFFGVVLLATFLIWFVAPFFGWWLPENVSTFGGGVDQLFYVITGFTAFFFVLTVVVLVYAMWRFAARPGEKAHYTHGNHRLELIWTAVPAAILLFIAFAQIGVWSDIKYQSRMPAPDVTISLLARQWEWRMRYPADTDRFHYTEASEKAKKQLAARAWAENPESDDIHGANEIHCWKGANVKVYMRTQDVLHSFTLPNLRLKQDTLPGKTIPMWFNVTRSNTEFDPQTKKCKEPDNKKDAWEIACQELCGGRHYAMRGRLYVHKDREDYEAWLKAARDEQQAHSVALGN
jgi:cytochrome c oxidase subunit 2